MNRKAHGLEGFYLVSDWWTGKGHVSSAVLSFYWKHYYSYYLVSDCDIIPSGRMCHRVEMIVYSQFPKQGPLVFALSGHNLWSMAPFSWSFGMVVCVRFAVQIHTLRPAWRRHVRWRCEQDPTCCDDLMCSFIWWVVSVLCKSCWRSDAASTVQ